MNNENENLPKIGLSSYPKILRRIWKEININNGKQVKILFVVGFVVSIIDAVAPLVAGKFFDVLTNINKVSENEVWIWLGIFITAGLIPSLISQEVAVRRYELWYKIFTRFIVDSVSKFIRLPSSFHNQTPSTELQQTTSRTANNISSMFSTVFAEIIPALLGFVVSIIAVASINGYFALIMLIAVAIFIYAITYSANKATEVESEDAKNWVESWRHANDVLGNISLIKQSASENHESKRLRESFDKGVSTTIKAERIYNTMATWRTLLISGSRIIVLGLSIVFLKNGELTLGQIIAVNTYMGMIFGPFIRIGQMWETVQRGVVNMKRCMELLDRDTENYMGIESQINGTVEFKNVSFYHDDRKIILDSISFKIYAGQKIAFVGETGSGKTSLTELISNTFQPTSGEILIDGQPIDSYSLTSLRSQIGIVPQDPALLDSTILENIIYPKNETPLNEVESAAKKASLFDSIQEMPDKWNTLVGERGVKLSGGQKQRVAIARAIIGNPRILILDESTSALDAKTQHSIEKALDELMEGRTTFIVAHRLSAVRNADVICVLHKGKIIEQGSHSELMNITDGKYKTLYNLQFQESKIEAEEEKVLE